MYLFHHKNTIYIDNTNAIKNNVFYKKNWFIAKNISTCKNILELADIYINMECYKAKYDSKTTNKIKKLIM